MSGVLNDALFHIVEALNFSVVGILICFLGMAIYILNITIHDDGISSIVRFKRPVVPKVNYEAVSIPFSCSLENLQRGNEKSINLTLKNSSPCSVHVHWQVCANALKSILHLDWPKFLEQINNSDSLKSVFKYDVGNFSSTDDEPYQVRLPIPELPHLGKPPRSKFPLIVCIQRTDFSEESHNQVGVLVSVIHLSDEDCPMPNVILYQYLKQYSGQLTQLKVLFTQSSETNKDTCSNNRVKLVSVEEACVICKVLKPVRALLPCRHVCVCSLCFPHIESCPMCRSSIEAFFLTDEIEAKRQEEMTDENGPSKNEARHRSFLNNMNGVLNSVLGIQQNE